MIDHIRQIKLDRVLSIPNDIDIKFQEIWNDLSILNYNVYNQDGYEFIYYNSNKEWIFFQDSKNNRFWCNYDRYWSIFKSLDISKDQDIKLFTKYMVEEALNKQVVTPIISGVRASSMVEEALNKQVATPTLVDVTTRTSVEEALSKQVAIPVEFRPSELFLVKEALNKQVITPSLDNLGYGILVEETLKHVVTPQTTTGGNAIKVGEALNIGFSKQKNKI